MVRGPDMTAEIRAVNRDFARDGGVGFLGGEGFAEFVRQDEGGLVLNVKIAAQLKRAMALGAVHEDGDGEKMVWIGSLRLAKIVPDCDAELMLASLALEERRAT